MANTMPYIDAIRYYTDTGVESRKNLARRAGVARSTLYNVLHGSGHTGSITNIERLLGAIGYRLVAEPLPVDDRSAEPNVASAIVRALSVAGYELRRTTFS